MLLLPAAVVLVPLSLLSFAGVLLPLLVPAVALCVLYARRSTGDTVGGWRAAVIVVTVLGLVLTATAVLLFIHPDPREYPTADGGSVGTSDIITLGESVACAAVLAVAVAAGWLLSKPRVRPCPPSSG